MTRSWLIKLRGKFNLYDTQLLFNWWVSNVSCQRIVKIPIPPTLKTSNYLKDLRKRKGRHICVKWKFTAYKENFLKKNSTVRIKCSLEKWRIEKFGKIDLIKGICLFNKCLLIWIVCISIWLLCFLLQLFSIILYFIQNGH